MQLPPQPGHVSGSLSLSPLSQGDVLLRSPGRCCLLYAECSTPFSLFIPVQLCQSRFSAASNDSLLWLSRTERETLPGAFVMMRGWGAGPGQGDGAQGGPGHTVRTTRATCHPHHRDILTALGLNSTATATAHKPHRYSLRLTSWAGPCLPQSS